MNFYGSSQVGYIILDPQTGAGAYKIGGGENGGVLKKIKTLLMKAMFWFGMHSGAMEYLIKYRFIIKSLGTVIAVVADLINIWSKCKGSIGLYLSLFAVLSSVALAIALFFATGGGAVFALGFVLPFIQTQIVNRLVGKFCR